MVREAGGIICLVATLLVFLAGGEAVAATLTASYQLQGDRTSAVAGAPALVDLGTGNRFTTETVDGVARRVLSFPRGNGLSVAATGLADRTGFSVVMTFRLAEVSGYRRLLDFTGGTGDAGLYDLSGDIALYPEAGPPSRPSLEADLWVQVILTSTPAGGGSQAATVYVNGVPTVVATNPDRLDLTHGTLRFFKDNTSGPARGEQSAGAVACILLFNGALTPEEVAQPSSDLVLCPAPRRERGAAEVRVTGRPEAWSAGSTFAIQTGLTARCPIGSGGCRVSARVMSARSRTRLGTVRVSAAAGTSETVTVRLSRQGARMLRRAGSLRVRVSAEIVADDGRAAASQTGTIEAPPRPLFRAGAYAGTTAQGLPILLAVARRGITSVYFRWRATCADGKPRTGNTVLVGGRIRRGRFSFERRLRPGGSVWVSGRIAGTRMSGTLSRTGRSGSRVACTARGVGWDARREPLEYGTP